MGASAPAPPSALVSALAAQLYGTTAVALAFVNKAVITNYGFKDSNVMLLLQMIFAAASVFGLRAAAVIELAPLSLTRARALLPIAALYCGNTAAALASLDGLSVPMYTVLKRLTPVCILFAGALTGKPVSRKITLSVLVTLAGVLLAGYGDLGFDGRAYSLAGASCVLQTMYLLAVQNASLNLSSWEMLLYNSLLSSPLLVLYTAVTGELRRVAETLPGRLASDTPFAATFSAVLFLGCLLNFAIFLCTRVNSALTTTIVGVLKGVAMSVLGFVLLGGVGETTNTHLAGIALNTVGGVWYAWLEYEAKQAKRAAFAAAAASASGSELGPGAGGEAGMGEEEAPAGSMGGPEEVTTMLAGRAGRAVGTGSRLRV